MAAERGDYVRVEGWGKLGIEGTVVEDRGPRLVIETKLGPVSAERDKVRVTTRPQTGTKR